MMPVHPFATLWCTIVLFNSCNLQRTFQGSRLIIKVTVIAILKMIITLMWFSVHYVLVLDFPKEVLGSYGLRRGKWLDISWLGWGSITHICQDDSPSIKTWGFKSMVADFLGKYISHSILQHRLHACDDLTITDKTLSIPVDPLTVM